MRVRRYDIPEQDVVLEPELGEHAMDDRRRRLGWAGARELTLGRERQPADARPAIACRLADEQVLRAAAAAQVRRQALAAKPRRGVLVERIADPCPGKGLDERALVQAASLLRRYASTKSAL